VAGNLSKHPVMVYSVRFAMIFVNFSRLNIKRLLSLKEVKKSDRGREKE
jgi:hypothetical protein